MNSVSGADAKGTQGHHPLFRAPLLLPDLMQQHAKQLGRADSACFPPVFMGLVKVALCCAVKLCGGGGNSAAVGAAVGACGWGCCCSCC